MSNLIKKHDDLFDDSVVQRGMRDGIEIEKGVVLNEDYLKEHFDASFTSVKLRTKSAFDAACRE